MANPGRVLVVDGLSETAEVLRAVLEPRGLQVDRIRGDRTGPAIEHSSPPSVIVLHDESPEPAEHSSAWADVPRIVIGSCVVDSADSRERRIRKPFQYGALISAIDELLARDAAR